MDDVASQLDLLLRSGSYHHQLRVRGGIAATYGKLFERRSLRTKDKREMAAKLVSADARDQQLCDEHRRALRGESKPVASAPVLNSGASPGVNEAMSDGLDRAAAHFNCPVVALSSEWAGGLPVVTAWAPIGPSTAALPPAVLRLRRTWDEVAWPRSNRGYSRLRSAIPAVLDSTSA